MTGVLTNPTFCREHTAMSAFTSPMVAVAAIRQVQ